MKKICYSAQCSSMHIQQKSQILGLGHILEHLCYVSMREVHFGVFWGLKKVFLSSYLWLLCHVFHRFPHFHKGNFTKYEKYPVCTECHPFRAPKSLFPRGNKSSDAFLAMTLCANWIYSKKCPFLLSKVMKNKVKQ